MPIEPHLLGAFLVTTTIAMISPGPDMMFILGCGIRGGPRAGLLATAGVATSEAVHVTLAAVGLAALFAAVPVVYAVIRIVGAAYLIYLGVQLIRRRRDGSESGLDTGGDRSGRRAYFNGLVTNLLNPKMVTFTIAFLPQFIHPRLGQVWLQFVVLGAIMIVLEFVVDGAVGVFASQLGKWLRGRRRARSRLEVATGGLFIGLGVGLVVDR